MYALIADDEPEHAEILHSQLTRESVFERVESVHTIKGLMQAMDEPCPEVVFLDLRFPTVNALELAPFLHNAGAYVIAVTAYPEFAINAYEAAVEDYLLKPVPQERLGRAVQTALSRIRESRLKTRHFLTFHSDGLRKSLDASLIATITRVDSRLNINTSDGRSFLSRDSLHSLLAQLPKEARLFQVSRNQAVNLRVVREIQTDTNGTLKLTLSDGDTISCSRRRAARFLQVFYEN